MFCGSCCCGGGGGGGVSDFSLKTAAATAFSSPLISAEMIESTDTIRLLGNRAIEVLLINAWEQSFCFIWKRAFIFAFSQPTHTHPSKAASMMYIIGTYLSEFCVFTLPPFVKHSVYLSLSLFLFLSGTVCTACSIEKNYDDGECFSEHHLLLFVVHYRPLPLFLSVTVCLPLCTGVCVVQLCLAGEGLKNKL